MGLAVASLGEAQISFGFHTRVSASAAAIILIGERCCLQEKNRL
jgi:hypothetical protein